jgi:hypothetical protein
MRIRTTIVLKTSVVIGHPMEMGAQYKVARLEGDSD